MKLRMIAAATAALAAGCSAGPAATANNATATAASAPAHGPPVQRRYDNTMSGQPLTRPPTPFELLVTQATFPAGHLITCHKHTWPRYVYLQAGHLRVTNFDARTVYDFSAGDILVESIDQWHQGQVSSEGPVTLVALEQVPRGGTNSTPWPPPPPTENPCRPWAR
jgi:quercetin dioxygenase-like cupin family protein